MLPSAGVPLYFLSVDFNKDLFPELCAGRKEYPPLVEFAELGKGGGVENFGQVWKRGKRGPCLTGRGMNTH